MKKNIYISLFLLLITLFPSFSYANNNLQNTKNVVVNEIHTDKNTTKNDKKIVKITKKDLKDELKRRKKYHKWLLAVYNESFSEETLEKIQENSQIISKLRELKDKTIIRV